LIRNQDIDPLLPLQDYPAQHKVSLNLMPNFLAGAFPYRPYPFCDCGHVLGLVEHVHSHIEQVGLQARLFLP
jgi:hypothetical protein